jgi:hypothetical protein
VRCSPETSSPAGRTPAGLFWCLDPRGMYYRPVVLCVLPEAGSGPAPANPPEEGNTVGNTSFEHDDYVSRDAVALIIAIMEQDQEAMSAVVHEYDSVEDLAALMCGLARQAGMLAEAVVAAAAKFEYGLTPDQVPDRAAKAAEVLRATLLRP